MSVNSSASGSVQNQREAPLSSRIACPYFFPAERLDERYERLFVPRRDVRYLRRNALVALGNTGTELDAAVTAIAPALTSCMTNQNPSRMIAGSSTISQKMISGINVSTRDCGYSTK